MSYSLKSIAKSLEILTTTNQRSSEQLMRESRQRMRNDRDEKRKILTETRKMCN